MARVDAAEYGHRLVQRAHVDATEYRHRLVPRARSAVGALTSKVALFAVALLAAACLPRTAPAPIVEVDRTWVYACRDGFQFSARVLRELVALRLPTRTAALPHVRGSGGTHYRADDLELRTRGDSATLRVGAETHAACAGQRADSPWDEARLLGAEFRAVGREPVWNLEIDTERQMRFLMEGASEVVTPVPEPVRTEGAVRYHGTTQSASIDVIIEDAPCTVVALGDGLTHRVSLTVNGFAYFGCGRMLGSAPAGD